MRVDITANSITELDVEAVVNPANPSLLRGSGLSRQVHLAAGPELEVHCKTIGPTPVSSAVASPSFALPCKAVIHAVTPKYHFNPDCVEQLEQCYASCLKLADKHTFTEIAFPILSAGINGFPFEEAATIAIKTILGFGKTESNIKRVILSVPNEDNRKKVQNLLAEISTR